MRATWPGAKSGNSSMTTLPLVVSKMSAFSRSLISAMSVILFFKKQNYLTILLVCGDAHFDHPVGVGDRTVVGLVTLLDLVNKLHAADDIADDGVLAIERR